MSSGNWQQVKQIAADALEIAPEDRDAFVRAASGSDSGITDQVFALIAGASAIDDQFLRPPPWKAADLLNPIVNNQSGFSVGQTVCQRFEIRRFVASGGMGDVFEAWDSELRERVALKTIRPFLALSPAAIESFKQEVKQARSIPHANVCNIHDLFCHRTTDGREIWFLSMEFLNGETLANRLRKSGPSTPTEALGIVRDIAAGLAAAHNLRIIHRDLKPGNIMVVPAEFEGAAPRLTARAVITDFGIAKTVHGDEPGGSGPIGTAAYMSPEQARGDSVGPPTDIFALGMVICELLTGEKPRPPRPNESSEFYERAIHSFFVSHPAPQRWKDAIAGCLHPDPAKRLSDVTAVLLVLSRRFWTATRVAAGLVAILLLMIGVAGFLTRRDRIVDPRQLTPMTDLAGMPSITPDGKTIAYASDAAVAGNLDIWVRSLPDGASKRLTTDPAEDDDPGISPDGKLVVFRSERKGGGVYVVDVENGLERLLAPLGRRPRFSPDGLNVAYWVGNEDESVASGQTYIISTEGGSPRRIASDFIDARSPSWHSNDGRLLLQGCQALVQSLASCLDWWVAQPDGSVLRSTGALQRIRKAGIVPHRDADFWDGENVLFGGRKAGTEGIWEIRLNARDFHVASDPVQVSTPQSAEISQTDPSVSANRLLTYGHLSGQIHIWKVALGDPGGSAIKVTASVATDSCPQVTRDGKTLVFARRTISNRDIWRKDLVTEREEPLVHSRADKYWPILEETTGQLVYEARGPEAHGIYILTPGEVSRRLCEFCANPISWFAAGRAIFFRSSDGNIALLDAHTGKAINVIIAPPGASADDADWSPATERLLFTIAQRQNGLKRLYSVDFPAAGRSPSGAWQALNATPELIDRPRWSFDGSAVYYSSDSDGSYSIWGRHYDTSATAIRAHPFVVHRFPNPRVSPTQMTFDLYGMSVTPTTIFLNVAETAGSIWTGHIAKLPFQWPL
jgi:eukaryotic-like serine/threonine-protein kinase